MAGLRVPYSMALMIRTIFYWLGTRLYVLKYTFMFYLDIPDFILIAILDYICEQEFIRYYCSKNNSQTCSEVFIPFPIWSYINVFTEFSLLSATIGLSYVRRI